MVPYMNKTALQLTWGERQQPHCAALLRQLRWVQAQCRRSWWWLWGLSALPQLHRSTLRQPPLSRRIPNGGPEQWKVMGARAFCTFMTHHKF